MPFFTVNFDLKTKMPSTVINKKILKLIYLKKKKNAEGKGVVAATPEVAGWPASHPQRWLRPPLGWLTAHHGLWGGRECTPEVVGATPKVVGATSGGGSQATPFSFIFFFLR
jgi:hypothetical protein